MTRILLSVVTLVLFVGWSPHLSAQSPLCARYPMPSASTLPSTALGMLEARIACLDGDLTPSSALPDLSLTQPWRPRSRPSAERRPYLGTYSENRYAPDSIANPYGRYGNRHAPDSVTNPYGRYGNPYSATKPQLFGRDGTYLGTLSTNPYEPDSIANPYGRYGSPYSPNSVNNPYGRFGSPYSPDSATNPYAITPPLIFGGR